MKVPYTGDFLGIRSVIDYVRLIEIQARESQEKREVPKVMSKARGVRRTTKKGGRK